MSKNSKTEIGIYIRVNQQADNSLEIQKKECMQAACKLFDKDVSIRSYIDEGKSAMDPKNRDGFLQMVQDSECGLLSAVITYEVSRFGRNLSEALRTIEDLHKKKVRFISLKEGDYGTPQSHLRFNILASLKYYQQQENSERIKQGLSLRKSDRQKNSNRNTEEIV